MGAGAGSRRDPVLTRISSREAGTGGQGTSVGANRSATPVQARIARSNATSARRLPAGGTRRQVRRSCRLTDRPKSGGCSAIGAIARLPTTLTSLMRTSLKRQRKRDTSLQGRCGSAMLANHDSWVHEQDSPDDTTTR